MSFPNTIKVAEEGVTTTIVEAYPLIVKTIEAYAEGSKSNLIVFSNQNIQAFIKRKKMPRVSPHAISKVLQQLAEEGRLKKLNGGEKGHSRYSLHLKGKPWQYTHDKKMPPSKLHQNSTKNNEEEISSKRRYRRKEIRTSFAPTMYDSIMRAVERNCYSSNAEFLRQAAREKLLKDGIISS